MDRIAEWTFAFLVFPGVLFTTALGLALSWVDRKVSARVQWRKGPPLAQPAWDVLKLLGKEVVVPAQAWAPGFLAAPFVGFAGAALAASLTWGAALGGGGGPPGDLLVVLYLLALPSLAVVVGGAASGNPLSAVGASRDMKLVLAYELPFAISLLVAAFQVRTVGGHAQAAGTLSLEGLVGFQQAAGSVVARPSGVIAFVVAILCCQAKLGFVPFDLAEADTELGEGALLEYSGPPLAAFKLTQAVQLVALPVLLVTLFWGGAGATAAGGVAFAAEVLLVAVVFVLVKNTNPRVRIDQALRFFWGPATALSAAALLLAQAGW